MLIDFDQIEESIIHNYRGGEKDTITKIFTDKYIKVMLGKLEPGASIGRHLHENNSEIVYILRGYGIEIIDDMQEKLNTGMCHYCPKGSTHSLVNNGNEDLVFFAVVSEQ